MIQRTDPDPTAEIDPTEAGDGKPARGAELPQAKGEQAPKGEQDLKPEEATKPKKAAAALSDAEIPALVPQLEACLFVAREPVALGRLADVVGASKGDTRKALELLGERYSGDHAGVHLAEIAGGWRFLSNPAFAETLAALQGQKSADRLSGAALETLAVIAYKQPVGRAEIERVRGVGAGPVLRHLLELEMIKVVGRDEGLGRALLYGTTMEFLDRFGLGGLRDLPANLES